MLQLFLCRAHTPVFIHRTHGIHTKVTLIMLHWAGQSFRERVRVCVCLHSRLPALRSDCSIGSGTVWQSCVVPRRVPTRLPGAAGHTFYSHCRFHFCRTVMLRELCRASVERTKRPVPSPGAANWVTVCLCQSVVAIGSSARNSGP